MIEKGEKEMTLTIWIDGKGKNIVKTKKYSTLDLTYQDFRSTLKMFKARMSDVTKVRIYDNALNVIDGWGVREETQKSLENFNKHFKK